MVECSCVNCAHVRIVPATESYRGRGEIGGSVSVLSAGVYTATLSVIINKVKKGRCAPHTLASQG